MNYPPKRDDYLNRAATGFYSCQTKETSDRPKKTTKFLTNPVQNERGGGVLVPGGQNLRGTLPGFIFFSFGCRLFFAKKPGADDAELIHDHQRKGHHDLSDDIRWG